MLQKLWKENKFSLFSILLACAGTALLIIALAFDSEKHTSIVNEQPVITFAVYGDKDMQKVAEEVTAVFMKQNHCKVEVYCYPTDTALREKVIGQFAAGKAFDVFCTDANTVSFLSRDGWLYSLDNLVEERRKKGDEFYLTPLLSGKTRGKQYALPIGVMPYMLYYNIDYFKSRGLDTPQQYFERKQWRFEDFVSCVTVLSEQTKRPSFELGSEWAVINTFVHSNGGNFHKTGEKTSLDIQAQGTVNTLVELQKSHIIDYSGLIKDTRSAEERFAAGELPMIMGDLSMTRLLNKTKAFQWDVVPMPSVGSDFSNSVFSVPLIAAAKGENERLASEFIDFYVSTQGQKSRLEHGECLLPSLNMTFYTSMGNVKFPDHSNYYFYALENGYADYDEGISGDSRKAFTALWEDTFLK